MPRILKTLGMLLIAIVVCLGGLLVGSKVRDHLRPKPNLAPIEQFMTHELMPDTRFPEVDLLDDAGEPVASVDLLVAGGVVLFIDPECPPCNDMGRRWQEMIDGGAIDVTRVWGVSYHPREAIDAYSQENDFGFPIYEDRDQIFRSEYGVKHYPLEVIVGNSGQIRGASYDSVSPVDMAAVDEQLAR